MARHLIEGGRSKFERELPHMTAEAMLNHYSEYVGTSYYGDIAVQSLRSMCALKCAEAFSINRRDIALLYYQTLQQMPYTYVESVGPQSSEPYDKLTFDELVDIASNSEDPVERASR